MIVLGVDHKVQVANPNYQHAQDEYRNTLESIIHANEVRSVGEEVMQEESINNIAEILCKEKGLFYYNTDIPADIKKRVFHVDPKPYLEDPPPYPEYIEQELVNPR